MTRIFHIRFADPKAGLVCVGPPRNTVFVVAKKKTVWRQRPETKSAGHLRIFRKARHNAETSSGWAFISGGRPAAPPVIEARCSR